MLWTGSAPVDEGLVEARKLGHPELRPLPARLFEHLKRSPKLFMDETRAPVLDPGRKRTKTGYHWVIARDDRPWGGGDPPAVAVCQGLATAAELRADQLDLGRRDRS